VLIFIIKEVYRLQMVLLKKLLKNYLHNKLGKKLMMKITQLLAASVLGLVSTTASSMVWLPDINTSTGDFQEITFASFGVSSATYDLVFFDAGTTAAIEPSTTSITLADLNGIVGISPNPAPYVASFGADLADLGSTAEFELALWDGSSFTFVTSATAIVEGNWYSISFGDVTGTIQGVDLAPVPVPAAVWLFGSGLIGLVGVARRRA
jgi:hypothetical protein